MFVSFLFCIAISYDFHSTSFSLSYFIYIRFNFSVWFSDILAKLLRI